MEIDFEVQHWPKLENMVADALSRLQSNHMEESYPGEGISERYVKHVDGTLLVHAFNSIEEDSQPKPTIDDFIKEQRKDGTCRILVKQIDDN